MKCSNQTKTRWWQMGVRILFYGQYDTRYIFTASNKVWFWFWLYVPLVWKVQVKGMERVNCISSITTPLYTNSSACFRKKHNFLYISGSDSNCFFLSCLLMLFNHLLALFWVLGYVICVTSMSFDFFFFFFLTAWTYLYVRCFLFKDNVSK